MSNRPQARRRLNQPEVTSTTSYDSIPHVLDRMAIKDVRCRYDKGIDELRFDLVVDCYAPHVSFRAPGDTLEG